MKKVFKNMSKKNLIISLIFVGILCIVSEYNPFHNGHILHLKESLKKTKADFTIAIMSGNFVERR